MHRTMMTLVLAAALGITAVAAQSMAIRRPAAGRAAPASRAGMDLLPAAAPHSTGASHPGSGDARAQVQRFVKDYIDARNRSDATAMMEMIGRTAGASAINEGTVLRGWEAIRDDADDMIAAEGSFKIVLGTIDVQLLGSSYALAVAPFVLNVQDEEGPMQINGGLTLVLEKADGRWKILHEHQSAQPPEEEDDSQDQGQ